MNDIRMRRVELSSLYPRERRDLVQRSPVPARDVRDAASTIVASIREGGDDALHAANRRYGGGRAMARLRIGEDELQTALDAVSDEFAAGIREAATRLRSFHESQRPVSYRHEPAAGVAIERVWTPLRRVGVYVPGGRAAYPSSLVMGVVPAQVAGVSEIAVVSPAGENGSVSAPLLAAAAILDVTEMYAAGGAQAIGALAYGTETIPRVDKIFGPGNSWVAAAKLAVFGDVSIDLPAGPSEAVVLADAAADPRLVAADLLCQAEHGSESPAVLVTTSAELADRALEEVAQLLPDLSRRATLAAALADHGLIVIAEELEQAIDFINDYAPEHAGVLTADPDGAAAGILNAGSVFVGSTSPHSAGDYATGANHVLPTGGLARSESPLSTEDFGAWRQVQRITREGISALRHTVATIADAEGLDAHLLAVDIRLEDTR